VSKEFLLGGQAVIEGVMMSAPGADGVAIEVLRVALEGEMPVRCETTPVRPSRKLDDVRQT